MWPRGAAKMLEVRVEITPMPDSYQMIKCNINTTPADPAILWFSRRDGDRDNPPAEFADVERPRFPVKRHGGRAD